MHLWIASSGSSWPGPGQSSRADPRRFPYVVMAPVAPSEKLKQATTWVGFKPRLGTRTQVHIGGRPTKLGRMITRYFSWFETALARLLAMRENKDVLIPSGCPFLRTMA